MKSLQFNFRFYMTVLAIPLFLWSCDDNDSTALPEEAEQRKEVYQEILNNEEMFSEFVNEMRANQQSMQWMASDRAMMRNMYGRRHMRQVMMEHPGVMDTMMQGMMGMYAQDTSMYQRNPAMKRRFMQHMWTMMERDTTMYRQMQERMQENPQ